MLSERQQRVLEIAVDAYLKTGTPVGSKAIAEKAGFDWGPSTVRAELAEASPQQLYIDGAGRLLSESHAGDLPHPDGVVSALEGQVSVLSVLRSALRERSVFLCIGEENPEPALRSVSVVGAGYGLGYRNLGAVGVVGPLRMDSAKAIDSVRDAAGELSRLFATVYEG